MQRRGLDDIRPLVPPRPGILDALAPSTPIAQRFLDRSGRLDIFEQQWDGSAEPALAFTAVDAYLRNIQ